MRSSGALLMLMGLFALCGSVVAEAEEPKVRRFALLIGIDRYNDRSLGPLNYCGADARRIGEILTAGGWEVEILTDNTPTKATRENILQQLKKMTPNLRKNDLMLVGWFGIGAQFDNSGPFLAPVDATLKKDERDTLISLAEMISILERGFGRHLVLIDVARNDPGSVRGFRAEAEFTVKKGNSCLLSCSDGEQSYESEKIRMGVFAHALQKGLRGEAADRQGRVTWLSLAAYTMNEVPAAAKLLFPQSQQTPQLLADLATNPVLLEKRGQ